MFHLISEHKQFSDAQWLLHTEKQYFCSQTLLDYGMYAHIYASIKWGEKSPCHVLSLNILVSSVIYFGGAEDLDSGSQVYMGGMFSDSQPEAWPLFF